MWLLSMRDQNRSWSEVGAFAAIVAAARRVLELEGSPRSAIFFRVYADPMMEKSDADILSRLEYQGDKGFYVLTRRPN
jgi:hypothetical protein